MTYRERLMHNYPELDECGVQEHVDDHCPLQPSCIDDCYYTSNGDLDCDKCWDQVIPGTNTEAEDICPESEISCYTCIHEAVCKHKDEFLECIEVLKDIPEWAEVILRCKHNL